MTRTSTTAKRPQRQAPVGRPARRARTWVVDERGAVYTVFVAILAPALIVGVGAVVDGGGKIEAARRADSAAYTAVRVGGEAAASKVADGKSPGSVAASAARSYLAQAGVSGSAQVKGRTLTVQTTTTYKTLFLGIIGIDQLTAHGESSAAVNGVR